MQVAPAFTPASNAPLSDARPKVIILGSGPIRIGQGIEFDYASVHCTRAIREMGYQAIVINNNPETVSTDFDISDRLYFEPLTLEDVLNIIDREQPLGVVTQFGGQTAINLAGPLSRAGVPILGTQFDSIDLAEDRDRFDGLLVKLGIPKPNGKAVTTLEAAVGVATEIGYPVLVRPSYVLGGRAMEIVYNETDLRSYMRTSTEVTPEKPILVDKYITGKEAEVDVICDGETCLLPGIMEHIERAGVHSGDSMAVYPPQSLSQNLIKSNHRLRDSGRARAQNQRFDEHSIRHRRRAGVYHRSQSARQPHDSIFEQNHRRADGGFGDARDDGRKIGRFGLPIGTLSQPRSSRGQGAGFFVSEIGFG